MTWEPCAHETPSDHSRVEDGVRIWRCSGCGTEGPWTESWSYYGLVECRRCWVAEIEWVACSEACRLPTVDEKPPRRPRDTRARTEKRRGRRGCSLCGEPGHYAPTCGRQGATP